MSIYFTRNLFLSAATVAAMMFGTVANAAITLVASDSNLITSDSGVTSLSSNFDMLTGNALVVSVPVRFGNPASDTIDVDFAGQSPDYSFIEQSGDRASVGTFLFLDPATTSGTVSVNLGSAARMGYAVYSLDGVGGVYDAQAFSENGNGNTSVDVQYDGPAGGYVINTLSGEGPGAAPSITDANIDVNPLYHANGDGGIFITAISSGGEIAADGTYTATNAYYRAGAMSSVSLYMIPEPSSVILAGMLACGGVAMVMRKRLG